MNSILRTDCGRPLIEVFYDPRVCDWDQAIQAAYVLHGLRPGQAKVICYPKRCPVDGTRRQMEIPTPATAGVGGGGID